MTRGTERAIAIISVLASLVIIVILMADPVIGFAK